MCDFFIAYPTIDAYEQLIIEKCNVIDLESQIKFIDCLFLKVIAVIGDSFSTFSI